MDSSKLTDEIDISDDIAEYGAPISEEVAQDNLDLYIKDKINLNTFNSVAAALITQQTEVSSDILFSEDKGYVFFVASNFYKELIKQAKRFNKAYCRLNGMILSGQRELKYKGKGQKYNKEFNPFLYKMYIRTKASPETTKKLLTRDNSTPEEASLKVSYALGFLDTPEYKSIHSLFHLPTLEKILGEPQWLEIVRNHAKYAEELKQIKDAVYVAPLRRNEWMEEVQNKIQEEVFKMKGSV